MLDQRGRLLVVALGFAGLRRTPPSSAVRALRFWLDSWPGLGAVVGGMAHQGYDLQLTRYDERGWRATFYPTGMEHSATSHRLGMGADAVARGASCGVGHVEGWGELTSMRSCRRHCPTHQEEGIGDAEHAPCVLSTVGTRR